MIRILMIAIFTRIYLLCLVFVIIDFDQRLAAFLGPFELAMRWHKQVNAEDLLLPRVVDHHLNLLHVPIGYHFLVDIEKLGLWRPKPATNLILLRLVPL